MADEDLTSKPDQNTRDETLKLSDIDTEFMEEHISEVITEFENSHQEYFHQREQYLLAMRDFRYNYRDGPFDNSSDLHVPFTQIMSKATHAKLFEVFSPPNLFSVEATNIAFTEREETVKFFMNWNLDKRINRGEGFQDVKDMWIDQGVKEGSGIVKLLWDRWEQTFEDVDLITEEQEDEPEISLFATEEDVEVDTSTPLKSEIGNKLTTKEMSAPAVAVVDISDFGMPAGYRDLQSAPFVWHRVFLEDSELKLRVQQGRFDKDRAEEAIEGRKKATDRLSSDTDGSQQTQTPRRMADLEGVTAEDDRSAGRWDGQNHEIVEWYGRAYIAKELDKDVFDSMKDKTQEVVIWYHKGMRKILGWTYLWKINPSGRRPFYKWDFMRSKERAFGVGTGELLWSINNYIDAMHNMKLDNGMLSSLQFGTYRAASTLKPDVFRVAPGELVPVENPDDVKFANFPFLGQFGEAEEGTLNTYGQNLLPINDINLGNVGGPGVAGALRNATGASFIDRQSNIQLNPHISRLAKALSDLMKDMFILARTRMSEKLYFRVTGQDGKGVFNETSKDELRGNFDFIIDTELAGASEAEKQQRATLMLQTLINPQFMQLGLVTPGNIYEILKKYLIVHQIRQPDTFVTKPADYQGPALSPQDRVFRIIMGQHNNPPIENTVRLDENHEQALAFYEAFKETQQFGLLRDKEQVAALESVIQRHQESMQTLQGAQGIPNRSGTQLPGEGGLGPIGQGGGIPDPGAPEGGPLGSPQGEVNGPVI